MLINHKIFTFKKYFYILQIVYKIPEKNNKRYILLFNNRATIKIFYEDNILKAITKQYKTYFS